MKGCACFIIIIIFFFFFKFRLIIKQKTPCHRILGVVKEGGDHLAGFTASISLYLGNRSRQTPSPTSHPTSLPAEKQQTSKATKKREWWERSQAGEPRGLNLSWRQGGSSTGWKTILQLAPCDALTLSLMSPPSQDMNQHEKEPAGTEDS